MFAHRAQKNHLAVCFGLFAAADKPQKAGVILLFVRNILSGKDDPARLYVRADDPRRFAIDFFQALGGRRRKNTLRPRQTAIQKSQALSDRLFMRIDPLDIGKGNALFHRQTMVDG